MIDSWLNLENADPLLDQYWLIVGYRGNYYQTNKLKDI